MNKSHHTCRPIGVSYKFTCISLPTDSNLNWTECFRWPRICAADQYHDLYTHDFTVSDNWPMPFADLGEFFFVPVSWLCLANSSSLGLWKIRVSIIWSELWKIRSTWIHIRLRYVYISGYSQYECCTFFQRFPWYGHGDKSFNHVLPVATFSFKRPFFSSITYFQRWDYYPFFSPRPGAMFLKHQPRKICSVSRCYHWSISRNGRCFDSLYMHSMSISSINNNIQGWLKK